MKDLKIAVQGGAHAAQVISLGCHSVWRRCRGGAELRQADSRRARGQLKPRPAVSGVYFPSSSAAPLWLSVRNPKSQPQPPATTCSLPTSGILCCDFVSRRTSKAVAVMEAKKFQALAGQFAAGTMSDKEKLTLVEVRACADAIAGTCRHAVPAQGA